MSGLEPVRLEKGGFPDLTGDGKVTQADILKGRGVEGFAEGGGISQFVKDYIVDVEDPLDIALLSLYALGPVGAGANKAIKVARTAKKAAKKSDYKKSGIEELIQKTMVKPGGATAGFAGAYDITDVILDDEEELPELKDGGVVHARLGKFFSKAIEKAKDALKKSDKKKKTGKTKKKAEEKEPIIGGGKIDSLIGKGIVGTGKTVAKNPRTTVGLGGGLLAYNLLRDKDKEEDLEVTEIEEDKGSNNQGTKEEQEAFLLKDILRERALEKATEAGREEISFMDYVKAFPGGYMEKVGKDPDFARQMMAGFLAMMKPTEGYVPRSGIVDFGEAALAEQARQEGEVPAAIQTLEFLARPENEDLMKLYLTGKKGAGGSALDYYQDYGVQGIVGQLVANIPGAAGKDINKIIIRDPDGKVISPLELASLADQLDFATLNSYISSLSIEDRK